MHSKGACTGELYFLPGSDDKRAINRIDSYIKPVCEVENLKLDNDIFNSIILINPGEVSLVNEQWVVTKKVKIEFQ